MGKLTATSVKAARRKPGTYQDGDGLMLVVSGGGAASWVLRVKEPGPKGRRRDFGLGSEKDVSLAAARDRATSVRIQVKNGEAPKLWWRKEDDPTPTFKEAATKLHGELKKSWKNGKHGAQWLATLEAHAFPKIGAMKVDTIDSGNIRDVLLPIWLEIPETARRVRQRVGSVLDWSHAHGYRPTEAPLRSVNKTLPRQGRRDGHFAAMPYIDVPGFVHRLREDVTWSRLAVETAILTATRSGEIRGARWPEIDFEAALWTIPADRMKAGKAHVVPLSVAALDVFKRARELATGEFIFPGQGGKKAMSDMTLTKLLRDMGVTVATVHGFRSSFRDWAAEQTNTPSEVAEAALAHTLPNKVEAAYRRTAFLDKRRPLMEAWAAFVDGRSADVIDLQEHAARKANTNE